jgi:hypothetical protein
MSDAERASLLLAQVRRALEKSRQQSPIERFRKMIDAGLINPDGTLRQSASTESHSVEPAASKG